MTNSSQIRNVAFIGVNHSGKTSLIEAILHLTGAISRRSKVQDGTTVTDFEPESISRQMSTAVALAHTKYKDHEINMLDCPGFVDFTESVKLALCGVDMAIVVVDAQPGRIHQIEPLLHYAEEIGLPRMVFINKLDKPESDFADALAQLRALTLSEGSHPAHPMVPLQYPINGSGGLSGFVDLLHHQAFRFGTRGEPTAEQTIPDDILVPEETAREQLVESLADIDDEVLEAVVEGKEPDMAVLERDLKSAVQTGYVTPVLIGSAASDAGVIPLLDAIIDLCPSPLEKPHRDVDGEVVQVGTQAPLVAQVLSTSIQNQSGKLSIIRIFTGTIRADSHLVDTTRTGPAERAGGLYTLLGKKQEPVAQAGPGSIVAVARLDTPRTGDTLVLEGDKPVVMWTPPEPAPLYCLAISPENRADEGKLSTLLGKLAEEDPLLKIDRDPYTREYCM